MIVPKIKQYITELILCVASFAYAFVRGRAKTCGAPKHVLVWQMAKLGDMVCTTPMFRALKNNYPDVLITVVGNAVNKQILEGNADIEEYIVFDGFVSVLKRIKERKYDAGFIAIPSVIALAAFFLGGVRCISAPRIRNGFSPYETGIYRALLFFVSEHPHFMEHYAPREYLRLLESVGIHTDDTTKHLMYSEKAKLAIDDFLKKHNIKEDSLIIGISPSAGNKIKKWPAERFAKVAKILHDIYGAVIFVIGGFHDREEIAEMIAALEALRCPYINTGELFSLDGLKAFIARLKLFIAVDTGPIYIAEAFGVPTVDIAGSIDEREQAPIGEKHLVIVPHGRLKPELHVMNARIYNEAEVKRQILLISVDDIVGACKKILEVI